MNVDLLIRKDYHKEEYYKDRKIIYGGFKGNMNWDYYLTGFEKSMHERLECTKNFVKIFYDDMIDDFKSPRFCEKYFFLFEDKFAISFTLRSWGDFMAAVENNNGTYSDFYGIQDLV